MNEPDLLCNPVDKIFIDGIDEDPPLPIYDEKTHLACYYIGPHEVIDPPIEVLVMDQFHQEPYTLYVSENPYLCVPSFKCFPEELDKDEDTYIDINCGGDDCDDDPSDDPIPPCDTCTCGTTECGPCARCIYPGAPEVCDGIDNACAEYVPADETDDDTDGYVECDPWGGTDPSILGGDDCDDTDPDVNPGETEVCDGKDNDCDVYPAVPTDESDDDTDQYVECDPWVGTDPGITGGNDCDDTDANVNPGAKEGPVGDATCSDTFDNDCDGKTDTEDRDCKEGGCLASAAASIYETDSVGESGPSDYLAYLLIPIGIVTFLVALRRKK